MKAISFSFVIASLLTQGLIASVHDPVQAYNSYQMQETTNKELLAKTTTIYQDYNPPSDFGTPTRQQTGGTR